MIERSAIPGTTSQRCRENFQVEEIHGGIDTVRDISYRNSGAS